jgi:membrane-associated protein
MEHLFHLAIELIKNIRNFDHVKDLIIQYNTAFYAVFFLIIFVETGLIFMPLLPGDSLLFIVGATIHATGALKIEIAIPLLILAALLGDNVNYFVGKFFGDQIKRRKRILFFKREYLDQTHAYYEKNGGKTVIMARFVPIVRTIAPFVAGAGSMNYGRYILFCITGAILWVGGVTALGYWVGGNQWVRDNIDLVCIGIVLVSILPIIWQFIKSRTQARQI